MAASGRRQMCAGDLPPGELSDAETPAELLQSFPDAETDEVYWIYRVSGMPSY